MEEALYDITAMRTFTGIDLGREPAPDETTISKFRHFLERKNLGERLFHRVNQYLQENHLFVSKGTRVIVKSGVWQEESSGDLTIC